MSMRKYLIIALSLFVMVGILPLHAWSVTIPQHYKMKVQNLEYFNPGVTPLTGPFGDGVEDIWGIADITQIYDADKPFAPAVWNEGNNGEHIRMIFWGLDLMSWTGDPGGFTTGRATVTSTGAAIPFAGGELWLWQEGQAGYLPYNVTGGTAARTAYNRYPTVSLSNGGLLVSLIFAPGINIAPNVFTNGNSYGGGLPPTGQAAGYFDVITADGGAWATQLNTNGFPTSAGNRDLYFQVNFRKHPDTNLPNYGWSLNSEDPLLGYHNANPIPKVCIKKFTNGSDANDPNGTDVPTFDPGVDVTWTYQVTNCGNVPVAKADVVVTDSQTGVTPAFASEISGNGDSTFDPGELWLYSATGMALDLLFPPPAGVQVQPGVCTQGGQQPPRTAYVNLGKVTIPGAFASDPSSYCNPPTHCVTIVKYTNSADANNPDGADVPSIGMGLAVNWTYKVTNCGNISVAMADVNVSDNQGVVPGYVGGDVNSNSLFDPGEIWIYQATGLALDLLAPPAGVLVQPGVCTHGQTEPPRTAYINLGTVTIPGASASDPSSYCNPPGPCVTIVKKTNGADANDPNGTGVPIIKVGDPVTWTYEIKNCGNVSVAKADVVLTDNQPGVTPSYTSGDVNNNGLFDPDEVWLYTASGTALDLLNPPSAVQVQKNVCTQGGTMQPPQTSYINLGTVTIPGASATDPSSYCNPPPNPCVKIVKYTNNVDANDPDAADVPVLSINDPVTWTYKVSNCGDESVSMSDVKVSDNQPGVTPVFDSVLSGNTDSYFDPGEVWLYKATGKALDLSIFQLGVTTVPNVCTHNSTQSNRTAYFNTGTVTIPGAIASDPSSYCNPPELFGACRMTGGNVTVENAIVSNPWAVTNSKAKASKNAAQLYTSYTVGGQIGAPKAGCADSPGAAFGEWTHTQHSGAEGSFTFHSGTNSAPDDSFIKCITCADPGWCVQARCAPFKQIFWEGTGVFHNEKGFSAKFNSCTVNTFSNKDKTYSLHYYKAHVGDFGEPGNTGKQKSFDPNVCKWRSGGVDLSNGVMMSAVPDDKFGDKGGQACEACPDWYEIEIHCTADPSSEVIYRGAGFITGGNYQIHPEVGQQCPF